MISLSHVLFLDARNAVSSAIDKCSFFYRHQYLCKNEDIFSQWVTSCFKRLCNHLLLLVVTSSVSFISSSQVYIVQDVYEENYKDKAMICCEFVTTIQCLCLLPLLGYGLLAGRGWMGVCTFLYFRMVRVGPWIMTTWVWIMALPCPSLWPLAIFLVRVSFSHL